MDKRGVKIIIACVACSLTIVFLFLIVARFSRLSCDLVRLDPINLRKSQLDAFRRERPIRSRDKTVLVRIAAYLEYNKPEEVATDDDANDKPKAKEPPRDAKQQNSQAAPANSSQNSVPAGAVQQTGAAQPAAAALQNSSSSGQAAATPTKPLSPSPSVPFNGGQQVHQVNGTSIGTAGNASGRSEWRFMPLELNELETGKWERNSQSNESRQNLTFTFNCTTLNFILVRQKLQSAGGTRAFFESISVNLKPTGKRQATRCSVKLPPGGLFAIETHDQLAHFKCEQSRPKMECLDEKTNELLAELNINAIEFELAAASSDDHVDKKFSKTKPKECEPAGPK